MHPIRRFKSIVAIIVIAVTSLGLGGAIAATPAHAATAMPATSPLSCKAYWWANVCFRIVGTGPYVNYFYLAATNETWPGTLYVESRVVGPGGFATPWRNFGIALQNTANESVGENRNMALGTYCGQFDIYGKPVFQVACFSVT